MTTPPTELKAKPILPRIAPNDKVLAITGIEIQPPIVIDRMELVPYKISCHDEGKLDTGASNLATESLRRLLERADVQVDSVHQGQYGEPATILLPRSELSKAEAMFEQLLSQISRNGAEAVRQ